MASKKMKRLGKAAALLAAGYAASKMGSDNTMDGTEGVFPASKPTGSMGSKYGFKKRSIMEDIKGLGKKMLEGPVANEGPVIPDSMMPMANKGMFVTVKTKMGKNKKTKIC
jgi:hypothetical protein